MSVRRKSNLLLWVVPATLLTASGYTVFKARTVKPHPLKFVPSGEDVKDAANLERIRKDWRERNNGIGLRDVGRSGGGV